MNTEPLSQSLEPYNSTSLLEEGDTAKKTIPFEFHLSVEVVDKHHLQAFKDYCSAVGAKALVIELARGKHQQQPMLSKVGYYQRTPKAIEQAEKEAKKLVEAGFSLRRIKIEIPFDCVQYYATTKPTQSKDVLPYYEWHGKLHYERKDALLEVCETHGAHLSRNALKAQASLRFITVREFGEQELFVQRVEALTAELLSKGWNIEKQQWEYCIYDNHTTLDTGWLEAV